MALPNGFRYAKRVMDRGGEKLVPEALGSDDEIRNALLLLPKAKEVREGFHLYLFKEFMRYITT